MTTYNTGNPVGSSDPRDLFDNASVADELVNGDQAAYNDRLGQSRKSWTGVEQQVAQQAAEFAADQSARETTFTNFLNSSGFEYLGEYAAGITFTEYNQYVVSAGEAWFIDPTTPLPYTTTGAGLPEGGALMSRGEALLRQELGSGIRRVDSLAGLQAISGRFAGDVAYMVGRTTAGDGGEGEFRWDGSDLSATLVLASVTSTSVDATTDTITSAGHGLVDGNGVVTTTAVNGLTANQVYWVVSATTDTFRLSETFGGAAVDLTGTTNFTVDHLLDPLKGRYVTAADDLTGVNGAWVRQGEYSTIGHFGGNVDSTADSASAISEALKYGKIKNNAHGFYTVKTRINAQLTQAKNYIDLNGVTLRKNYAASASIIKVIGDGTNRIKFFGASGEALQATSNVFFEFSSFDRANVYGITCQDDFIENPIKLSSVGDIKVHDCYLIGLYGTAGQGIDVRNESNCDIYNNTINDFTTAISATATNTAPYNLSVHNNTIDRTFDSAVFLRLICNDTVFRTLKNLRVSNNYLNSCGKSGIKVEIPNGDPCSIENVTVTGNIVSGFGVEVASSGLHYAAIPVGSFIQNLASTGNIVTSVDASGTTVGLSASTAVRATGVENGIFQDSIYDTVDSGFHCSVSNMIINHSIYRNTNISFAGLAFKGGIIYDDVQYLQDHSTVNGAGNLCSGIYLRSVGFSQAKGIYANNADYGIYVDSLDSSNRIRGIQFVGAAFYGNTSGPYGGGGLVNNELLMEIGCIDDDGDRCSGSETRRDSLSFPNLSSHRGFIYVNTTTNKMNMRIGGTWYNADGTLA